MWPSPLKLFLDIESEDDLQRNRAATSSENGNRAASRNPIEEETASPQTSWLTSSPSDARVIREKLSAEIAYSISVFRRPSVSVDLDRVRLGRSDQDLPWLAMTRVSKTPVFEPAQRSLFSIAGIRTSWSVGAAREDPWPVRAAGFESPLPIVMTPSTQSLAAAAGKQPRNVCKFLSLIS